MAEKPRRKDKRRMVLRKGESQRKDGSYDYRWTSRDGKRHSIYAKTLEELREKEDKVANDQYEGLRVEGDSATVNDLYDMWCNLKRGLKDSTFQNYKYTYTLNYNFPNQ
ncbi:MAG: integrase DNA-binding domain-containing protein [Oribacterium sp.]